MRALVTGAGGFIGRAVLHRAPDAVSELRAILGPTDDPTVLDANVARAQCDIRDEAWWDLADGIDVIIHLAGPASVAASFTDPTGYVSSHVLGAQATVRVCSRFGVGRLVHVSSAEVYGAAARTPVAESDPLAPRSPYGAAKVGAEAVVGAAVRAEGLDAVVLRPFSIYGPGMRRDSLLGTVIEQATQGRGIAVHDLSPVRDHCLVDDVADAVWAAALRPEAASGTFNVGSGRGIAVGELAALVLELADSAGSVTRLPDSDRPTSAAIPALVADVRLARWRLGWHAGTSLEDGLRMTIDRHRAEMALPPSRSGST